MTYPEQLARIRRFLDRLEKLSVNEELELPTERQEEYEDMLYAFFQNCWHLKDWIRNDATAPSTLKDDIESHCKHYQSLMLCADVADGTKHLTFDKQKRTNKGHRPGGKIKPEIMIRFTESFATGESTSEGVRYQYRITDNAGNSFDALDLAKRAVSDWETLITTNGGTV